MWVPNRARNTLSEHELRSVDLGPRSVRLAKDDTDKAGGQHWSIGHLEGCAPSSKYRYDISTINHKLWFPNLHHRYGLVNHYGLVNYY